MTYCSPLAVPLEKHIEEKKTLDEIGLKICGDSVKNPRRKAIRLIRLLLGEKTLIENANSLKYDISKANLSKKRKQPPQRKCSTEENCPSLGTPEQCISDSSNPLDNRCSADADSGRTVVEAVRALISCYGRDLVIEALILLKISVAKTKETSAESAEQNATLSCLAKTPSVAFSEKGHEKPS